MLFHKLPIRPFLCWFFLLQQAPSQDKASKQHPERTVTFAAGKTYLQPKKMDGRPPTGLNAGQVLSAEHPFALVAGKDSFLEIRQQHAMGSVLARIGRSTALEFDSFQSFSLFQGSVLLTHREPMTWKVQSPQSQFVIEGKGTWMTETTAIGFKLIPLEGEMSILREKETHPIRPGDLILVTDLDGKLSQKLKIELPLLLSTSRLFNNFPDPLPSHSRLISAAQVQALRTQKKYEAIIGGVSKNRKLEIWQVGKSQAP